MGVKKVAVLGGGVGGITTAFALTSTPELRDRFEVTVYQRGWRIGGKGASGRNAGLGNRIEEHGLHVWFGFYDNAFRLMDDCYRELNRPSDHPLATLSHAFTPCDTTVLYDHYGGGWYPWTSVSPRNPYNVGDEGGLTLFWDLFGAFANWVGDEWHALRGHVGPPLRHDYPPWVTTLANELDDVAEPLGQFAEGVFDYLIAMIDRVAQHRHRHRTSMTAKLLAFVRDELWDRVVCTRVHDDRVRVFYTGFDAVATAAIGIINDNVLENGFTSIDQWDLAEWLHNHGLHDITIGATLEERAPVLRAIYDMAFCFAGGDANHPSVAAGTSLRNMIRLGGAHNRALYFKMQAGMGDAVFGPYYEVLAARGVKFEFFHWVDQLRTDGGEITAIEMVRQAALVGDGYDPLVDVQGLPCWPSEPRWEQLADGEALRTSGLNLEFVARPPGHTERVLERGRDFDSVVLAIPVGALPAICGDLAAANERFALMLESSRTTITQAFQVWMRADLAELGFTAGGASLVGCHVEPLDTYADMSHLLAREDWPGEAPRSIGYFCGVLPDHDGESLEQATQRAKESALHHLRTAISVPWPNAVDEHGALRWELLHDPQDRVGEARFDAQYWRANADASERYVLSPPGLVLDRLAADESGFANLVLAGDWTRNGLDAGCVEAATISGLQAARAVSAFPFHIVAEDDRWLTTR